MPRMESERFCTLDDVKMILLSVMINAIINSIVSALRHERSGCRGGYRIKR